jgi:inorganic pyrophosphatase
MAVLFCISEIDKCSHMFVIEVVIETPKGSAQKYSYDHAAHFFKLKKMLPAGMIFPYDFGFIPRTKAEDGDPLDVLVISELQSFPGCMIECRIIGGFESEQAKGKRKNKMVRNDRFFAVPTCSKTFGEVLSIKELPEVVTHEIEAFFIDYNKLEEKKFIVLGKMNARQAAKKIKNLLQKK